MGKKGKDVRGNFAKNTWKTFVKCLSEDKIDETFHTKHITKTRRYSRR